MRNMMILVLVLCFAVPSATRESIETKELEPVVEEVDVPVVDEHEDDCNYQSASSRSNGKPAIKLLRKMRMRKK